MALKIKETRRNNAYSYYDLIVDGDIILSLDVGLIKSNPYISSIMVTDEHHNMKAKLEIPHKKPYVTEEEILDFIDGNKELLTHVFLFGGN